MPSRPTCSAWWVEGLCSCGIMRVGKVTYARRAAWKGLAPRVGWSRRTGHASPMAASILCLPRRRVMKARTNAVGSRLPNRAQPNLAHACPPPRCWPHGARRHELHRRLRRSRCSAPCVVQRQAIWRILFLLSARPSLRRWRVSTPMLRDRSRRSQPHGQRPLWCTSSHPRSHV